jgi:hypothetical protein
MIEKLLQLSLGEVKNGYAYEPDGKTFKCLVCGKEFGSGEIYMLGGRFYDALKAVQVHIVNDHGGMFEILASYDKKYTGVTENQKELMTLFYTGLTDNEAALKTGTDPSTVRHQRFVFREKAKQAKIYLAIYEILEQKTAGKKKAGVSDDFITIHSGARMIDDRYFITKAEEDGILSSVFETLDPPVLKVFSSKEKKKIVILRKIASQFTKGIKYTEKEVNDILKPIYHDKSSIRRYLIEYGFMDRTSDGREYRLK